MLPLNYDSVTLAGDQKSSFGLIALFKFSRNTRDDKLPDETPPPSKRRQNPAPGSLSALLIMESVSKPDHT